MDKPTILIADDSKASRGMMQASLPEDLLNTYDIVFAENGQQAVEQYQANQPALSFLDLTMPIMDGMDALKTIIETNPTAKIVIVTADTQKTTHDRALKIGALDYINKPISAEKLTRKLSVWL